MKSYKRSLCAMILLAFLTVGLAGCCSGAYPNGGGWFGAEPEHQGPQTMKEYLDQPRPSY